MSDVVVTVVESVTNVAVTDTSVDVNVVENPVEVSVGTSGPQGATGATGTSYTPGDPIYVTVRNATGSTMVKGTIVYTSGANGTHTQVTPALATSDATSARTLGWLAEDLANNADGLCQVEGYLDGVNTQGITAGAQLYLSGTTAGAFQVAKPSAPVHLVYVGVVAKVSAGNGRVYVKVQNGYELSEIHDVAISSPADNQVLTYESSTGLWKNKTNTADGVQSVVFDAPLTGGTVSSTGTVGLDQSALTLTQSQVTNLTTDLAAKANLAGGNTFTGLQALTAQTITSASSSATPLSITSPVTGGSSSIGQKWLWSSDTANWGLTLKQTFATSPSSSIDYFFTTRNNSTTDITGLYLQANGAVGVGGQPAATKQFFVNSLAATNVGAVIRGAVSQSANLTEWQNSAGTVLAKVAASGELSIGQSTGGQIVFGGANGRTLTAYNNGALSNFDFAAVQTYFNSDFLIAPSKIISTSNGSTDNLNLTTSDTAKGVVTPRSFVAGGTTILGQVTAYPASAATKGLVVRGAASQTANLQEWQDSSGNILSRVNSLGYATFARLENQGLTSIGATVTGASSLLIDTNTPTRVGAIIKGAASQSANLTEWQNSAGTVLTYISSSGALVSTLGATMSNFGSSSGIFNLYGQGGGGILQLSRRTAVLTNPGANIGSLYFRDGTNAGTLKLVVRAGAAGAETTILDNIPQ